MKPPVSLSQQIKDEIEHEIEVLPLEGGPITTTDSDVDTLADLLASIMRRILAEEPQNL